MAKRDLLSMLDVEDDLVGLLELAQTIKRRHLAREAYEPLKDRSLAMIFEKASTRTRVSFEVGMTQLGGHALYLNPQDTQLGRGETVADTARVLSRYVDGILYRAFQHADMLELARWATVPVINGLDNVEHPCQVVSDLLTIQEKRGGLEGLTLAYVGDGNNVAQSLLLGGAIAGMTVRVATPKGYEPDRMVVAKAREAAGRHGGRVEVLNDPREAAAGADVLYTDVWVSMGMEKEKELRMKAFAAYQLNAELVGLAKEECLVLHCLPAHRGLEITDEVIDGPRSAVFEQAENRLHAQKAILARLLAGA
ncbi:MAG TPA: ornithine carbamoyltransferase [Thermoplasmata archaeon]|nr:ornithine carbamoyltransferase [Thermoplasmata archaeon]